MAPSAALAVLRRALRRSPDLRRGLGFTIALALIAALGRVAIPVLIQQIVDRGLVRWLPARLRARRLPGGARRSRARCTLASRALLLRLVRATEDTLYQLRVDAFAHIHRLSLATTPGSRGACGWPGSPRDTESIERFLSGGDRWVVDSVLIVAALAVMAVFAWQLAVAGRSSCCW